VVMENSIPNKVVKKDLCFGFGKARLKAAVDGICGFQTAKELLIRIGDPGLKEGAAWEGKEATIPASKGGKNRHWGLGRTVLKGEDKVAVLGVRMLRDLGKGSGRGGQGKERSGQREEDRDGGSATFDTSVGGHI